MDFILGSLLVWTVLTAGLSSHFAWQWYRRRDADDARHLAGGYAALTALSILFLVAHRAWSPLLCGLIILASVVASLSLVAGVEARASLKDRQRPSSRRAVLIGLAAITVTTVLFVGLDADGLAAGLDMTFAATFVALAVAARGGPRLPDRMGAILCIVAALAFSLRIGLFVAVLAHGNVVRSMSAFDHAGMSYLMGLTFFLVLGALLTLAVLEDETDWQRVQALYDPATSLLRRPPFFIEAQRRVNAAPDAPHVMALLDVDRLGGINVAHGEAMGHAVLARLGRLIWQSLPRHALAGRFGGDETVLFFPHATLETATPVLEALRARVEAEPWPHGETLTVSIGHAEHVRGQRLDDALMLADAGLQHVKMNGRNQVRAVRPDDFDDPLALSAAGGRSVRRAERRKKVA